jgi:hypothetical protein
VIVRRLVFVTAFCCANLSLAQQPVAPTQEPIGPVRGDDWGGYNFVNSFETGYRFVSISGNTEQYRATENFGNGIRLLNGFLSVNSKDGHGKFFDEIVLTTSGLGGDPYESASLRVQKNRMYEYDMLWRLNDYFNPGLTTDGGQGVHLLNTTYTLQDHNLTLFPQSAIRFSLGYTRDRQTGAGISTDQLFQTAGQFDPTGNVFPLFTNIKYLQNEYRLGGEIHWLGFALSWMHAWQDFKDDTPYAFSGFSRGDNTSSPTSLTSFLRTEPIHGTSPYWRVGLFRNDPHFNINGRFTYTSGMRDFISNEVAVGVNQRGAALNQQIVTFGNARRPFATGNLNVSLFPTKKLTVVNQTSLYSVRSDGNSAYLQFDNATGSANLLYYQYLGIRTVANETDVKYQLFPWLDLHGGYQYSNRRISSTQQIAISGTAGTLPYFQTNELNSGNFGFHITPLKQLNIMLDDEIGRSNRPFTPKGDKNYNVLTGRVAYKLRKLQLAGTARSDYNNNSLSVTSYSSHTRLYSASASWNALSWFGLDATYSKTHVDTLGGIDFFAQSQLFQNQVSYYVSNIHAGTLTARLNLKRADLYVGYSHVQDTGDGRASPISTIIGPNLAAFRTAQTFPLKFESPLARLSIRISERIRWNVGYQYYGYNENFFAGENYHANTGYTSVLWSF